MCTAYHYSQRYHRLPMRRARNPWPIPAELSRRNHALTRLTRALDTFLSSLNIDFGGADRPTFVPDEVEVFLACGILARGFQRLRCDGCMEERRVAFSCKGRFYLGLAT